MEVKNQVIETAILIATFGVSRLMILMITQMRKRKQDTPLGCWMEFVQTIAIVFLKYVAPVLCVIRLFQIWFFL